MRHIYNMGTKSSTQEAKIRQFFTRCLPIAVTLNDVGQNFFSFLNVKFFLTKCRKLAVEDDWNSKISQNVQSLFFWLNRWVFFRKTFNFIKIVNCGIFFCTMRIKWYYFLKMSFHLICKVLLDEIHKIFQVWKIRKYETEYVKEKNSFI